jgi:gamma-glutamyltranspeptidase/glutathione hydrolase
MERSSPHAVTVPGAVDAWCRLLKDFGRMPMADVLQPAIAMAREGYALTPRVAADLGLQRDLLAADPTTRATFLVEGEAPAVGSVQRQPLLADTLEAIACDGKDAFYRHHVLGDGAATICAASAAITLGTGLGARVDTGHRSGCAQLRRSTQA